MNLMGTIESTFSRVNSTVFRQVNRATDWWNLPTPGRAAEPARPPRRPARAQPLRHRGAARDDGAADRRELPDVPHLRRLARRTRSTREMGMVGSRFGRNAPDRRDRARAAARAHEAEPARGRQPAAAAATSSSRRPASTCSPPAGSSSRTTTGSATARTRPTRYIDVALAEGRRVAGRHADAAARDAARTAPATGTQRACRRPTSTPSRTGGTARRSTARPRSATASCARARTAS